MTARRARGLALVGGIILTEVPIAATAALGTWTMVVLFAMALGAIGLADRVSRVYVRERGRRERPRAFLLEGDCECGQVHVRRVESPTLDRWRRVRG